MKILSRRGFTIVELLIVVVIIAILATITIVTYNGIVNRASDTAVMSDLKNATSKGMTNIVLGGSTALTPTQVADTFKMTTSSYLSRPNGSAIYGANPNDGQSVTVFAGISKSGKTFVSKDGRIEEKSTQWTTTTACSLDSYFGMSSASYTIWNASSGWVALSGICYN